MTEKCCNSMEHYEHMCSLTLNGCAIEKARQEKGGFECAPCEDPKHNHRYICTPSLIGA